MGNLREQILRQELQKEIEKARKLEKDGKHEEASKHYTKVSVIYRRIAYNAPRARSEEMFDVASQYENLGTAIRKGGEIEKAREFAPDVYEKAIDSLIITQKPETEWDDIGGLKEAKRVIKEAIILPFIHDKPPFIHSPRTILLVGPPGTGKTLLAKASSNILSATFFEARVSALLSKYFGESGKLVGALFDRARKEQPSLVFIDELDSIAVARSGSINEATRRVLGEFLTQIEGFNTKKGERVLTMGATNKPWDVDDAIISRFQRKIYVPLPDEKARKAIFRIHLEGADTSGIGLDGLVRKTQGFSGRDIASACQEAVNSMVREQNPDLEELTSRRVEKYTLRYRALRPEDFEEALNKIRPAVSAQDVKKYEEWGKEFGG